MKIVIRDRRSGQYLKAPDEWVEEVKEAWDFNTSSAASQFATNSRLREVDIVVKFTNSTFDIWIPV